jgi:hypothetical protein
LGLLIVTAASAVTWWLVAHMDLAWLASYVMAAAIGWVLYRLARVNTVGIVLWCLAVVVLGTGLWALPTGKVDGLRVFCALTWLLSVVASSIVFFVAGVKDRTHRGRNCACCDLALFTLIGWIIICVICANVQSQVRRQEDAQQTTETLIKLHKLATEIESFRARLGRLPKDEEELVALRGEPMPTFYQQFAIHYKRLGGDRYELTCSLRSFWGYGWDLWGWHVAYYGCNSPRRIQVILF